MGVEVFFVDDSSKDDTYDRVSFGDCYGDAYLLLCYCVSEAYPCEGVDHAGADNECGIFFYALDVTVPSVVLDFYNDNYKEYDHPGKPYG